MTTPVAETVETVTEPVAEAVSTVTTPVAETVETVTEPLAETVATVTTPVAETVEAVTEPVAEAVATVTTPVAETVETVTEPVAEAVATVTTPVAETVEAVTEPVAEAVQATVDPVDETVATITTPSGAVEGASETGVLATLVPDVPVAVPETVVGTVQPTVAMPPPDLVPVQGPDVVAGHTGDLLPPATETSSLVVPDELISSDTPFLGDLLDGILTDAGAVAGVLPVAAAVGVSAVAAVSIARGVFSPSAPVMFTNVRLLPCVAASSIERTSVAAVEAVSKLGSSGSASVRSVPRVADAIIDPFRDGFDRAVRGSVLADDPESLRDGRLMAQIGIVLGTIYMAFLTVWFWATRVRWNPRASR